MTTTRPLHWLLGSLTSLAATLSAAETKPLNFLWLIAEDTSPSAFSCYGEQPAADTPAIDQLAREGVRYDRFYTTAPVCSPARSAFTTGMYQTSIGSHQHRTAILEPLPAGSTTLNERFAAAGYTTANIRTFPPALKLKNLPGKTDWNFATTDDQQFQLDDWDTMKVREPFYTQVNFHETHRIFANTGATDRAAIVLPPYYPEDPAIREDYGQYLDSSHDLDHKIALILAQLEADGLADHTVVIFMGDNGEAHVRGKQFCYEEGLRVPMIVRWPPGYPPPAHYVPGTVDDRLLEAIDVFPTLLDLSGIPVPPTVQGVPFLGDHVGPPKRYIFGARDRCDETPMRLRTVRDERYRYIRNFTPEQPFFAPNAYKKLRYPGWTVIPRLFAEGKLNAVQAELCAPTQEPELLFDLEADPHEIHNLASSANPEHQTALVRLRQEVDAWIERTGDMGAIPEQLTPEESMKGVQERMTAVRREQ